MKALATRDEVPVYKTQPCFRCTMPSDAPLNVLVLNASLKHEPELSNTGELASLVLEEIGALAPINADAVRLSDSILPVGLGFREAQEDDWPGLVTRIKAADIVLFCTPIWWGGRSSLMQRVIERLDALDEEYSATGRSAIRGKVAGIVITGSEDGALDLQVGLGARLQIDGWQLFQSDDEVALVHGGHEGLADEQIRPDCGDQGRESRGDAVVPLSQFDALRRPEFPRLPPQPPAAPPAPPCRPQPAPGAARPEPSPSSAGEPSSGAWRLSFWDRFHDRQAFIATRVIHVDSFDRPS